MRTPLGVVARLNRRAELVPNSGVGEAVRKALNAAIALELHPSMPVRSFLAAAALAGMSLVESYARSPVTAERHLEDMRLVLTAVVNEVERQLSREEVCEAWRLLKSLQQLHLHFPEQTTGMHGETPQASAKVLRDSNR